MNGLTIGGIILTVLGIIMILVLVLYINKKDRGQAGTFPGANDGDPDITRSSALDSDALSDDQKLWKNIRLGVIIGAVACTVIGVGLIGFGVWKSSKKKSKLKDMGMPQYP